MCIHVAPALVMMDITLDKELVHYRYYSDACTGVCIHLGRKLIVLHQFCPPTHAYYFIHNIIIIYMYKVPCSVQQYNMYSVHVHVGLSLDMHSDCTLYALILVEDT
jgi:hypothetical protein